VTTPASVSLAGVAKSFGALQVLSGVDLEVPAGSFTAILGPSGSGKTTLLRIIAGFERTDGGAVTLAGAVVDDGSERFVPPERRSIGFVPQEGALFPHLSAGKNIGFGIPKAVRRDGRVGRLMEMVGLKGLAKRYPHQLSGGQQQRVALARALAIEPSLVLLDEPFSSLDASLRASVRADVQAVLRRAGTTAILVTHDQDEALSMADRVAVIRDGCIGQLDTPERLYTHPSDPDLARFLGDANLLAGTLAPGGRAVVTVLGTLEVAEPLTSPAGGPPATDRQVVVLIRPEQLELTADPGRAAQAGTVVHYEYYGHDAVARVRPAAEVGSDVLVVRLTGENALVPGTTVGVSARGPVRVWPAGRQEITSA
jgi:iron(III) transport system ATP-binding protein